MPVCKNCGQESGYTGKEPRVFCSPECTRLYSRRFPTTSRGAVTEYLVIADLFSRGHEVFKACSTGCFTDLVAYINGQLKSIQVRTGHYCRDGTLAFKKNRIGESDVVAVVVESSVIYLPPL